MSNKKAVIFYEVNCLTIIFMLLNKIKKNNVFYFKLSKQISKFNFSLKNYTGLSYEERNSYLEKDFYDVLKKGKFDIYDKLIKDNYFNELIKNKLEIKKNYDSDFNVVLLSYIQKYIRDVSEILPFVDDLNKKYSNIELFIPKNLWTKYLINSHNKNYKLITPIYYNLFIYSCIVFRLVIKKIKNIKYNFVNKKVSGSKPNLEKKYFKEDYEILFFPHQGIFYGNNLFTKDHYYSYDSKNLFYFKNIFHLSLGESNEILSKSYEFYNQNNIPYGTFNKQFKIIYDATAFLFILIKN